jgi:hypothetical protein
MAEAGIGGLLSAIVRGRPHITNSTDSYKYNSWKAFFLLQSKMSIFITIIVLNSSFLFPNLLFSLCCRILDNFDEYRLSHIGSHANSGDVFTGLNVKYTLHTKA